MKTETEKAIERIEYELQDAKRNLEAGDTKSALLNIIDAIGLCELE